MSYEKHIQVAEYLANALENKFDLGPWHFGLDPIIGVIPVIGDLIPLLVSFYILWIGRQLEIPNRLRYKMIFNTVAEFVFGSLPFLGGITDFFWKANLKNIRLLRKYIAQRPIEGKVIAQPRGWAAMAHS